MANTHNSIVYKNKTFKKLFTDEEKANIRPVFMKNAFGIRRKGYWIMKAGSDTDFIVYTDTCVVKCVKIDPTKGPFQ